jgi:hypothetical protein
MKMKPSIVVGINSPFLKPSVFCKPDDDDLFGDANTDNEEPSSNDDPADEDDPPSRPAFDASAITSAIADGFRQIQPQQSQQPQLTAEELAERMGVWDPSDDEANELSSIMTDTELTGAQKKKAFIALRDKIVNQAVRSASAHFEGRLAQLQEQVAPAMQVVVEQRKRAAEQALYSEFPGLKPHKQVVDMVAREAAEAYRTGRLQLDPKLTANEFIAKQTFNVLRSVNPAISKDVVKRQPKGSAPKPAVMSTSGKAGGSNNTNGSKSSIWG